MAHIVALFNAAALIAADVAFVAARRDQFAFANGFLLHNSLRFGLNFQHLKSARSSTNADGGTAAESARLQTRAIGPFAVIMMIISNCMLLKVSLAALERALLDDSPPQHVLVDWLFESTKAHKRKLKLFPFRCALNS